MFTHDGNQIPHLGASVPLCPLDPRGERDHAHRPWLSKLEPEANSLILENHTREMSRNVGASCGKHQPPGVTAVSVLEGEANLRKWKRLLGDFQVLHPFLSSFSGTASREWKELGHPH